MTHKQIVIINLVGMGYLAHICYYSPKFKQQLKVIYQLNCKNPITKHNQIADVGIKLTNSILTRIYYI